MIKHYIDFDVKSGQHQDQKFPLSWTKISELRIGSCQYNEYANFTEKQSIGSATQNKSKHGMTDSFKSFAKPSFPYKVLDSDNQSCRLDICEVKSNILETAFETAESVASIGAVISI